jgi:hypothetical protein
MKGYFNSKNKRVTEHESNQTQGQSLTEFSDPRNNRTVGKVKSPAI